MYLNLLLKSLMYNLLKRLIDLAISLIAIIILLPICVPIILILRFTGEGEVFYKGVLTPTEEVFKLEKLEPIKVELREGLALMNGTSVMTGIGLVNTVNARKLLNWAVIASSAINEIVQAYDDHLSSELNDAKKHIGQQQIAKTMREYLKDSTLTRKREQHLYKENNGVTIFEEKVQEYYSLRCVPQILGPVLDTLNNVERILIEEVNSANDNPIVNVEKKSVYHGGNFHGDYVSLEMDEDRVENKEILKLSLKPENIKEVKDVKEEEKDKEKSA